MNKEAFNPHKRFQNLSWSILQITLLRNQAVHEKSTTYIIYAALECRIIIERLELTPLAMAIHSIENETLEQKLANFKGIQKVNSQLKVLKFRYQSFSAAFAEVITGLPPVKPFDYNLAEKLQSELADYIHIYKRSDEELNFESEFIQNGVQVITKTLEFLKNCCALHDDGYVQMTLNFNSLNADMKAEFKDWLTRVDEDIEGLKSRIRKIKSDHGTLE